MKCIMIVGVNHYRVANPFHLLLLLVELLHLGELVCVQQLNGLVAKNEAAPPPYGRCSRVPGDWAEEQTYFLVGNN